MGRVVLPKAIDRFDERVDAVLDRFRTGRTDSAAHVLSSLADRSVLWVILATLRALRGRPGDARAAVRMIAVVGVESAVVHGLVKRVFVRERPTTSAVLRFGARRPPSSSFPSGHTASAVTAAILLSDGTRGGILLGPLAAAVGWSRAHTALHHASDVLAGAAVGAAVGVVTRRLMPLPEGLR